MSNRVMGSLDDLSQIATGIRLNRRSLLEGVAGLGLANPGIGILDMKGAFADDSHASNATANADHDAADVNGNPQNKLTGLQSMSIGPGDGAVVEFVLDEPGTCPSVNHSFGHASHGAEGLFVAE